MMLLRKFLNMNMLQFQFFFDSVPGARTGTVRATPPQNSFSALAEYRHARLSPPGTAEASALVQDLFPKWLFLFPRMAVIKKNALSSSGTEESGAC